MAAFEYMNTNKNSTIRLHIPYKDGTFKSVQRKFWDDDVCHKIYLTYVLHSNHILFHNTWQSFI